MCIRDRCRPGLRPGPCDHADGGSRQHPRRDRFPEGKGCLLSDDGGSVGGGCEAAGGASYRCGSGGEGTGIKKNKEGIGSRRCPLIWLVGRNSCPAALSDGRSEGAEKKIQDHQNEYDIYTVIYKCTMFRIADLFQYIYLDGYHEEIAYHIQNGRKDGEGENRIPGSCVNRGNNPQGQGRYKSFLIFWLH